MIYSPRMIMIGASGRNSGKTLFACGLIEKLRTRAKLVAAKVTTIEKRDGECPRGGEGCGTCSSLEGDYCLQEETLASGTKNTQRLLASGAHKVFWLRVMQAELETGARALLDAVGPEALVICESNSLRKVMEPDLFFMFQRRDVKAIKPSARIVMRHADCRVHSDGRQFDFDLNDIDIQDGRWVLRYPATAILVVGGSQRAVGDLSKIQSAHARLRPHFAEMIVCAQDRKCALSNATVVPCGPPEEGPLASIDAALEASGTELNLVVSCDASALDMRMVRRMFREIHGYDAVMSATGAPSFGLYRKSVLTALKAALTAGKRDLQAAFASCRVKRLHRDEGTTAQDDTVC